MPKLSRPRHGSLQFKRKRAAKMLPRVNWEAISKKNTEGAGSKGLMGVIGYKVGMTTVIARDSTPNSMTKEKKIAIPATIIEVPAMKILSVRLYKYGTVKKEIMNENLDKELKKKIKLSKKKTDIKKEMEVIEKELGNYDDMRIIVYSIVKKTGIKRKPDIIEVGINGTMEEKLAYVKEKLGKEIIMSEVMKDYELVDVKGLSRGKGLVGPVKRYGLNLKSHKSEKGVRRPGSLAPWHPARTTYMSPQAGQLGMFTKTTYNVKILTLGKISELEKVNRNEGIKNYGMIRTEYLIVRGSIQGPAKRALIVTTPLRITKKQAKKKFEVVEIQ